MNNDTIFSQPIDMATKLVQKLLWTAITHNVLPLLNLLLQDFIRAETFVAFIVASFGYVRAAGVIPALYHVMEQYYDGPVHSKGYYILSECLQ
jgi:hypothetical protein